MRRRELLQFACGLTAGCARQNSASALRVLAAPYVYMSPLHLAHEQGYFAAEGLDVHIESQKGSNLAIPLLAGGKADATFFSINPALANAVGRGARLRIVAGRQFISTDCVDDWRLMGTRLSFPEGFTQFGQLRGKRIGLHNPSSNSAFQLDACLAAGGITRDEVKIVVIKDNEGVPLFVSGNLDVLMSTSDEMHVAALQNKIVFGPSLTQVLPGFMYSYIVFGKRLLDGDPEIGIRFLRAYLRGAADFVQGKNPRFLLEFIRQNGLSSETPRRLCRSGTALDARIPMADIQRFLNWCAEHKFSLKAVPAGDLVDSRFTQHLRSAAASPLRNDA